MADKLSGSFEYRGELKRMANGGTDRVSVPSWREEDLESLVRASMAETKRLIRRARILYRFALALVALNLALLALAHITLTPQGIHLH